MFNQCPGQDSRKAKAESIVCAHCGYVAEIFSDEIQVKCSQCKHLICKERLPSCVDWCKAARECVGEERYKQLPPKADSCLSACLPAGRAGRRLRRKKEAGDVLLSMRTNSRWHRLH